MGAEDPVLRGQILTEWVMKLGRGFEQCRGGEAGIPGRGNQIKVLKVLGAGLLFIRKEKGGKVITGDRPEARVVRTLPKVAQPAGGGAEM